MLPSLRSLYAQLIDQTSWLWVIPLGLVVTAFCLTVDRMRGIAAFYLASGVLTFAALVWAYWASPTVPLDFFSPPPPIASWGCSRPLRPRPCSCLPSPNPMAEELEGWDLDLLARATRLADWMFEEVASAARGHVAEVGPGLGTFSNRLLAAGVKSLLLVEPDPTCVDALGVRFGDDPRVRIVQEELPAATSLLKSPGMFDFVLCQNVLEHVREDTAAVEVMARSLRREGRLAVLVPAGPRLFGALDRAYGHERRYTQSALRAVMEQSGLRLLDLRPFNLLGILLVGQEPDRGDLARHAFASPL